MKHRGITLVEIIMSVAVFALVLSSLVSFLFTMSDASRTQVVAHDVLSYHREVTIVIDSFIRSASNIATSSVFSSTNGVLAIDGGDGISRSFSLVDGSLLFTSSTIEESLFSNRILVDKFFIEPVIIDEDTRGITYSLGVRSSIPDFIYRVDTTSTILLRAR